MAYGPMLMPHGQGVPSQHQGQWARLARARTYRASSYQVIKLIRYQAISVIPDSLMLNSNSVMLNHLMPNSAIFYSLIV